jgi:hypothetical protein
VVCGLFVATACGVDSTTLGGGSKKGDEQAAAAKKDGGPSASRGGHAPPTEGAKERAQRPMGERALHV